jgi:predicted nucleic acid-binding protein
MSSLILADAGPLVALFNFKDRFHGWAVARFREFDEALVTAEPVFTEALYLLRRVPGGVEKLLTLWQRSALVLSLSAELEKEALLPLMRRFAGLPISFADACLIRLSEIHAQSRIWSVDTDFRVYRRHGRQAIPLLMPA